MNLKYVDNKGMACTACNEFGEPNGMFVTGCTSYKVDSLTKHEKPKQHEKCALVTKAKLKSREESSAAKIIQTLNKDILIKLDKNVQELSCFGC